MHSTKPIHDSLPQVMAFVQTVRQNGFAAAGRKLGLSASAVGKSVTRLEERLGVKLLNRTTRSMALTEIGQTIFQRYVDVLDLLKEVDVLAGQDASVVSGHLRLDLPKVYGARVIGPMLARFAQVYPAVSMDIRLNDEVCNLVTDQIDLAVRIGSVADSSLIARPFDQQHLGVVASPAYLARCGEPLLPDELVAHQCLGFRHASSGRVRPWYFQLSDGTEHSVNLEHRYQFDEGIAVKRAAEAGFGIAQLPTYMTRRAVREGTLIELLNEFMPCSSPVHLIYAHESKHNLRVRTLVEFLLTEASARRFGPMY